LEKVVGDFLELELSISSNIYVPQLKQNKK